MGRSTLISDDELKKVRHAIRFGDLTFAEAARQKNYSDGGSMYNAILRYEKNRNLKPSDVEPEDEATAEEGA